MPLMREKRFNMGGFRLRAAVEAERSERLKRTRLWRYLAQPSLRLADRMLRTKRNGNGHSTGATASRRFGVPRIEPAELRRRVDEVNWYHTIDLGDGIVTPGAVDCRSIARHCGLPASLAGKRVIDVGTCDGFWAFEMENRNAAEVVATDLSSLADYDVPRKKREQIVQQGEQTLADVGLAPVGSGFQLAHEALGSKVKREIVNVYELSPEKVGMFDLTFVGYLLVHLRDPQTALENIFSVTQDRVLIVEPVARELEGMDRPLSTFVGTSYLGVWWEHNTHSWELMMRTAGFQDIEVVGREDLDFDLGENQVQMSTVALTGRVPPALRTS